VWDVVQKECGVEVGGGGRLMLSQHEAGETGHVRGAPNPLTQVNLSAPH